MRQPCHCLLGIIVQVPALRPSLADPFVLGIAFPQGLRTLARRLSRSSVMAETAVEEETT